MSTLRVNSATSWAAQIAGRQVRVRRASTLDPASVSEARDAVRDLRTALAKLEDALPARPRTVTQTTSTTTYTDVTTTTTTTSTTTVPGVTGSASSSSAIVATGAATAASLTGTAEVNTAPTSFSPRQPTVSGASTATVLLSGVYSGTASGTVSFTVTSGSASVGRTIGGGLPIDVRMDLNGTAVETFTIGATDPPGTVYTMSNGLKVSFGAGNLRRNASWSTTASTTTPTSADPAKAMNGIGDSSALLDEGVTVTNGSFTVNGTSVAVGASDSIDTVLARISATTDVDADYDPATDRVTLTQKTAGAGPSIALAGDTSGFLAAMKLNGATVSPGTGVGHTSVMADITEFAGVSAGTILVNGTSVAIDPATMSLYDVLDAIQASGAGVNAAFNDITEIATLSSATAEAAMTLDSNGTGFFDALHIADGTYGSDPSTTTTTTTTSTTTSVPTTTTSTTTSSRVSTRATVERMREVARAFNRLHTTAAAWNDLAPVSGARNALKSTLTEQLGTGLDSAFGLRFVTREDGLLSATFGEREERELRTALRTDLRDVREDLVRKGSEARSLIETLRDHLTLAERQLATIG